MRRSPPASRTPPTLASAGRSAISRSPRGRPPRLTASAGARARPGDRGRLPPDRAHDRRGRAPLLRRRHRPGVRRRQRGLRLGLRPRAARVEARRPARARASRRRAQRLLGEEIRANAFTYYQCIHGLGHGRCSTPATSCRRARPVHGLTPSTTRSRAPAASSWRTSSRRTDRSRSGCARTTCSIRAASSRRRTSSTATCS